MEKKQMMNLQSNQGFTGADIVISIGIIMIFVALITTVFYQFYLSTSASNRNAMALNCVIDIIEGVKQMPYEQVNEQEVKNLIERLANEKAIPNGYTALARIEKYQDRQGNEEKQDVLKILHVTVSYSVGKKLETIDISTVITK